VDEAKAASLRCHVTEVSLAFPTEVIKSVRRVPGSPRTSAHDFLSSSFDAAIFEARATCTVQLRSEMCFAARSLLSCDSPGEGGEGLQQTSIMP
jgi:hypothetical protein